MEESGTVQGCVLDHVGVGDGTFAGVLAVAVTWLLVTDGDVVP